MAIVLMRGLLYTKRMKLSKLFLIIGVILITLAVSALVLQVAFWLIGLLSCFLAVVLIAELIMVFIEQQKAKTQKRK